MDKNIEGLKQAAVVLIKNAKHGHNEYGPVVIISSCEFDAFTRAYYRAALHDAPIGTESHE